jgi:putative peptidoglycan lipid II flippase
MSASRLERATLGMALGTLLSRLTGLARITVAAYVLGFGALADVFNLANTMPNIIHDLVLDGVLSATFVPVFVDLLATRSERDSAESISAVVTLSAVVLAVSTAVFLAIAPVISYVYFGSHPSERDVATELLLLFAPQLLCYGMISLITAMLNSKRRFAAPMYAPILNNVVAIATLLIFDSMAHSATTGTVGLGGARLLLLGGGTTLAVAIQAVALIPGMRRCGLEIRPVWRPRDVAVRTIIRLSGWTFGFVLANQIAVFVVLALAARLEDVQSGAITVYTYGFTFFQLPFGIVAVSVMSALTPDLAERFTRGDLAGMRSRFAMGTRQILGFVVPAAVGYLLLAPSALTLLLHHYAASSGGVDLTASVVALFALGLPGFCTFLLAIRAFQAMRDTRTAFYLYLLENGCNIVAAYLFFEYDRRFGVRGLALSLSIAYTVGAIAAYAVLRHRIGGLQGRSIARSLLRVAVLSLIMAFVVATLDTVVGADHGLGLLLRVLVAVVGGVAVYFGGAGIAGALSAWQTSRRHRHAR